MIVALFLACAGGKGVAPGSPAPSTEEGDSALADSAPPDSGPADSGPADSPAPDSDPPDGGDSPALDSAIPCEIGLELRVEGESWDLSLPIDLGGAPSRTGPIRRELLLHNPCAERLHFLGHPDHWVSGAGFALESLPPVYLDPEESASIALSFTPGAEGPATGAFSLPHDQPGSPLALALQAESEPPLHLLLVGDGGHIFTSADYGQSARADQSSTLEAHTDQLIRGACALPGLMLAVGGNAEQSWWWSTDGAIFTAEQLPGSPLGACACDGGRCVAFDWAPWFTTDGLSWTEGSGGVGHHLRAIAAGSGLFVAVGDSGQIAVTEDGSAWTHTAQLEGEPALSQVAWGGGLFVGCGADGVAASSADGVDWIQVIASDGDCQGLVWAGEAFYLGDGDEIWRSEDGVDWEAVNAASPTPRAAVAELMVGTVGNQLYISEDGGYTWSEGASSAAGLGFTDGVMGVMP
jgi:hypothetical protein